MPYLAQREQADLNSRRLSSPFVDEALRHVERILASPKFERLQQKARELLVYLVAQRLLGRREIREITIAMAVWNERPDYDPIQNTKVRVALCDLRNRLIEYDAVEGRTDPIQILIPPRAYLPEIRERRPTVALVPILNWNPGNDQDYLCTAVADEILHRLTHSGAVRAARVPQAEVDAAQFAYSLRGTLECQNHGLRLNISLADNVIAKVIFGRSFEAGRDDLFKLSRQVAEAVLQVVQSDNGAHGEVIRKETPERFQALQLCQRGLWHLRRRTAPDILKAIELFEQAIEANRNFARAYSGLADCLLVLSWYRPATPDRVSFEAAKGHALTALRLSPQLPQVRTSLGYAKLLCDFDLEGAEEELRQAILFDNCYAQAHHWLANLLVMQGRFAEAEEEMQRAFHLDRGSIVIRKTMGDPFYYSGRYDSAIDAYGATLRIDPTFWMAHFFLGLAYEQTGECDRALEEFNAIAETDGVGSIVQGAIAHVEATSGRGAEARSILRRLQEHPEVSYVAPHTLAVIAAGLGERDRAFEWLEASYENRIELVAWIKVDPRFAALRDDSRFGHFLRRIGLSPSRS